MTTTVRHYPSGPLPSGDGGVSIASCNACGALIGDPVTHANACPHIPAPPPDTAPSWLTGALLRHRAAGCDTCQFPKNPVVWADHLSGVITALMKRGL